MRIVPVDNLKPDMELAKSIYHKGLVLLNAGNKNVLPYKDRLKSLGINYIFVADDLSRDIEVNDVIKDGTRLKARQTIKKVLDNILLQRDINLQEIKEIAELMIDDVFSQNGIITNLIDIKSYDSYIFSHCVNVAAISVLLGKLTDMTRDNMVNLCVGALLHDVGKVFISKELLNKQGKLTAEEFSYLKEHARLGYDYLKEHSDVSPLARIAVLSHHEKLDGSGYPKGLQSDQIHIFARIASIADVFDALTSDRIYRKKWMINEVVDYLIANANREFDQGLVELFTRNIAIYPNGTMVILSNGQKAIVKDQNRNFPMRPIVKVVENPDGHSLKQPMVINLMEELGMVITDIY